MAAVTDDLRSDFVETIGDHPPRTLEWTTLLSAIRLIVNDVRRWWLMVWPPETAVIPPVLAHAARGRCGRLSCRG